jgi:hypothetical protein
LSVQPRIYVVRSRRSHGGSVTYKCPTAEWALQKLRDAAAKGYSDVTVLDPDGRQISETNLIGCVEDAGTALGKELVPVGP